MGRKPRRLIYGLTEGLKSNKFCKSCNEEKHLSDFYQREYGAGKIAYSQFCKPCAVADRCRRSKENQKDGLCPCGRAKVDGLSQCESCIAVRRARFANPTKARRIYDERAKQRQDMRRIVLDHYGHKCSCPGCNITEDVFLAIDHIGGWGKNHKSPTGQKMGSYRLYAWIIKNNFPDTFRTLCHNCNSAYGFYGYCPHNSSAPVIPFRRNSEAISAGFKLKGEATA